MSGISFLPIDNNVYEQAPFEAITEDEYNDLVNRMPQGIDWSKLESYENDNRVEVTETLACAGGACEVVDLVE